MDVTSGWCGEGARAACALCSSPAISSASPGARGSAEHLGGFNVELMEAHAARVLDDARALSAISTLAGSRGFCPSATRIPALYAAALGVLRSLDHAELWPTLLVRWELQLLGDLGFGLDLTECAATGADVDLAYVSPRSGRAVSRDAGKPYCSKLLKLPAFLLDDAAAASDADILVGTGADRAFPRARRAGAARPRHAASARAPRSRCSRAQPSRRSLGLGPCAILAMAVAA